MMMFADLHLHTRYSDGTYTPVELIAAARNAGLSEIALTDHDTLDGCAEVAELAAEAGIGFIPGTEITAALDGRELHILGYCVDPDHAGLSRELRAAQDIRRKRVKEMVARLNARDIPLSLEGVLETAHCSAPGRPHVARALVAGGFCASLDEAFDRFLKKDKPGWVPKRKMSAAQALDLIHAAGGVAVMAHPGLNHDDRMIVRLARMGIDGLECHHPKHGPSAVARYEAMARELGLLITGGSDCHGMSKARPTIGTVKIPGALVDELRARVRQREGSHPPGPAIPDALEPTP
ncbi:MAG: PHP domain-containing protein [Limisphaerales bacterium]